MELGWPECIWRRLTRALCGSRAGTARSVAAALVVLASIGSAPVHATGPASGDLAALLHRADEIKTSDHVAFTHALASLRAQRAQLSGRQALRLRYLEAWELVYSGDYAHGLPELDAISNGPGDATLRFRAAMTAVNTLVIARRYADAYSRLGKALERLPHVTDPDARLQGIAVAAFLYDEAGQYELAIEYADRLLAGSLGPSGACKGIFLKLDARVRKDPAHVPEGDLRAGIEQCARAREPLFENLIVVQLADTRIGRGQVTAAISLLRDHYDEVRETNYPRLMSEFDAMLGKAYWSKGDAGAAAAHARRSIEEAVNGAVTKPLVDDYRVLYEVARKRGDLRSALDYQVKFDDADRGYVDDRTERTLAFRMVQEQVRDDRRRIAALDETNSMLQLRAELARKATEVERLYVALLLLVLASATVWAVRAKRSQIHFQRLARRDGLTGILNRQQFVDEAKAVLRQCAKSGQDAALILIDLDNFKMVNDLHGHVAGDAVLQETVTTCLQHMRQDDLFGRVGGEEFGVLLPHCAVGQARERAETLRAAIAAFAGSKLGVRVSASFGVASARACDHDLRRLLLRADSALYRAKRAGRNRVESAPDAADIVGPA